MSHKLTTFIHKQNTKNNTMQYRLNRTFDKYRCTFKGRVKLRNRRKAVSTKSIHSYVTMFRIVRSHAIYR